MGITVTGTDGNDDLQGTLVDDDLLIGLAGDDSLGSDKESGDDTLDGGAGVDIMYGGPGDDFYIVDSTLDRVRELSISYGTYSDTGGDDTVSSSIDYKLPDEIEDLILTGNAQVGEGNSVGNLIVGNDLANKLIGNGGADTLVGNGGADTLAGGAGPDRYVVGVGDTIVEEGPGSRPDVVETSVSWVLGDNLEVLVLTGDYGLDGPAGLSGTGNGLDNTMWGTGGADTLLGLEGRDSLVGGFGADRLDGGAGADTLVGGRGGDTYVLDADDTLVETGPAGDIDTVEAAFDYTLGANLEALVLTGPAGRNGAGNALDNAMFGTAGDDTLSGLDGRDTVQGGAGKDALDGGAGNDSLFAGAGADIVFGGAGNDLLDGGSEADKLAGDAGNDRLLGGAGADTLTGGAGKDVFVFAKGGGKDVITDFQDKTDRIDLDALDTTFAKLKIVDLGADLRVTAGSTSFVLKGFADASKLGAADFLF